MSFSESDLVKYEQFKTLVSKTKVEIQGDAVIMAASLMQWFYGLKEKIEHAVNQAKLNEMKLKEEPIKKGKT